MVQRMAGPEQISANALSKEVGITQPTLSRWLRNASRLDGMQNEKGEKSKGSKGSKNRAWSVEEKLRVIAEAARLGDDDLGAFLRNEGVHEATVREWREAAASALAPAPAKGRNKKTPEAKKIAQLEGELVRKEKALAELAALITLQKKVRAIWGDGGDDMDTRSGT